LDPVFKLALVVADQVDYSEVVALVDLDVPCVAKLRKHKVGSAFAQEIY
jgi:hypothetical protein